MRVGTITRGWIIKENKAKKKELEEIEQICKFNFKEGINTETMEKPTPSGFTFYESDLKVVLVPHNDPVVIVTSFSDWRISCLLADGGSTLSLLYLSY